MFNTRSDRPPADDLRTEYRTFEVNSLTPHIGAEVRGVDLAQPLSNEQAQDVSDAWRDWKVLVFRDQHLDREQHKAFGRRFGSLHVHPMQHTYGGDPEILMVKTTADSPYTAGDGWHTDVTCDEIPPLGSMLYVTETPASGGGDNALCGHVPGLRIAVGADARLSRRPSRRSTTAPFPTSAPTSQRRPREAIRAMSIR